MHLLCIHYVSCASIVHPLVHPLCIPSRTPSTWHQVQNEAASLATCVAQLKEQQCAQLVDALGEDNPVSLKDVLDGTAYFAAELAADRARLTGHRNRQVMSHHGLQHWPAAALPYGQSLLQLW